MKNCFFFSRKKTDWHTKKLSDALNGANTNLFGRVSAPWNNRGNPLEDGGSVGFDGLGLLKDKKPKVSGKGEEAKWQGKWNLLILSGCACVEKVFEGSVEKLDGALPGLLLLHDKVLADVLQNPV